MLKRLLLNIARNRASESGQEDVGLRDSAMRLHAEGRSEEALTRLEQALNGNPTLFWSRLALGDIQRDRQDFGPAAHSFRQALDLNPPPALAARIMAKQADLEQTQGRHSSARTLYRRALELDPEFVEAHYNLGLVLGESGEIDQALEHLRRTVELKPDFAQAHSSLLGMQGLYRHGDPQRIYAEHVAWARRYADPLTAAAAPHDNHLDPDRRLSIGYVSGDFREHSMSYFIAPILSSHDRTRFKIFCYDNWPGSDEVNARLRRYIDCWRKIDKLGDDAAAALIRSDAIDVLVDLSGHTTLNRLMVFARKAAPVQASWLGYMCTTGLAAMDYRITDAYLDPPGATERHYAETLVRIDSAAVFSPSPESPAVGELPALSAGHVTFGSFNNYAKITDETLGVWGRILQNLTAAHLLLVAQDGDSEAGKRHITKRLELNGVPTNRVRIMGRRPMQEFLQLFQQVDLALDPFPCSGGTTSLHTLWMGVPILSMEGDSELSRSTAGMLRAAGLDAFVVRDMEDYVRAALRAAQDVHALASLRAGLRDRMRKTPLFDGPAITRSLESAYRGMWRRYVIARNARLSP